MELSDWASELSDWASGLPGLGLMGLGDWASELSDWASTASELSDWASGPRQTKEAARRGGLWNGRGWVRTSDFHRVRMALFR
jgi:hypothetical protein